MSKKSVVVLPTSVKTLEDMGNQIKLARLRRKLSSSIVCERAHISRATLWAIEKGSPSVAIGHYANVLLALGMANELSKVAKDDALGRTYQDLDLKIPKRVRTNKNE